VYQTIIGLLMVALTALGLWWVARRRYRCPYCGRIVRWADVNCPHCGDDMKMRHREGGGMSSENWVSKHAAGKLRPPPHRRHSGDH
jgi:zinc-ribbon domain